ncbi:unnamed protein product [Fraxinus pennsylvanica]|uniref:WAT1-related protein n=1 Tax=Fraxinus pennsylvanica TaxID=56036 RepID=A0AAD1ZHV9_9LAMI|nr:unnamed protein product [Fraxinus pennsylvanica]
MLDIIMAKICDIVQGLKPTIMMMGLQITLTGVNIFYKLAANCGMSLKVLVAYRFMFASLTVIPFALILERQKRPKLTWRTVFQAFLIALFGLEKLGLNTKAGKAKVFGTLMGIGGAMLLTFYKGCRIDIWSTHFDLLKNTNKHPVGHVAAYHETSISKILGPLLAFASCVSAAFSLIVQAKMSEGYPCHYSSSALISVMGTIQAFIYALSMERNWNQWKLGWNLKLLVVAYMGIVGSGLTLICLMCCIRMRGPFFVSVFSPVLLVLVALAGSLLLNEKLHLGSVIGAAIIVLGLYAVLWGKSKEIKRISQLIPTKNFKEGDQADNIASESVKNVCMDHSSNIMAIAPNFLPKSEIEIFDDEEADQEVNAPRPII